MRKVHIALLGIFAAGVLLGGIGTGVAFGEYSAFDYGGKVLLDEDKLVTKQLEYTFDPQEQNDILLSYCYWGDSEKDTLVVEDESVPVGVVRYDVTYNPERMNMRLIFWETDKDEEEIAGEDVAEGEEDEAEAGEPEGRARTTVLELRCNTIEDDMAVFMKNKDHILEDLKNRRIAEYEVPYITDVSVHVNPETLPYITDQTTRY